MKKRERFCGDVGGKEASLVKLAWMFRSDDGELAKLGQGPLIG